MTTTIQVRTNPKTKKSAQKILEKMGLDLSTAINMYLMQIVQKQRIPFDIEILTENGMTVEEELRILKEVEWAKKHGKRFNSARELHKDIMGK
jgi:DNA-damage-inducible protein J